MIRNIRIGLRSALAFGVLGACTLILGLFSVSQLSRLNDSTDQLTLQRMPAVATVADLRRGILRTQVAVSELSDAKTQAQQSAIQTRMKAIIKDYDAAELKMSQLASNEDSRNILKEVTLLHGQLTDALPQLFTLTEQGLLDASVRYREDVVVPLIDKIEAVLDRYAQFQIKMVNIDNDAATDTYLVAQKLVYIGIALTILVIVVLAYVYSRSLIVPLSYAVEVAKRIASGDLTQQLSDPHRDEAADMLRALADMQQQLAKAMSMIGDSSTQLAATSEELSVVTHQSSVIVTQQSDQLSLAATAVSELTSAIEEVARIGKSKIVETISALELLKMDMQDAENSVLALSDNVANISTVLDVIRAIAEQTNLLALNAAIEAARAGENGRGFAVVADEVRALAHRTQQSTADIETMITAVSSETRQTVSKMGHSNELANSTLTVANDASVAFEEISVLVSEINGQNATVASAAEEQAVVAREVDENLVQIKDLSVQTSAGADQTKASSEELATLAEHLNELVSRFKIA
ncbi:methyl-accepting chemotaxis protein [Vibrio furnissii]|uniref:methyl-accepting chemotaxis protein n=1 Tax=Vibrio furnissii TaxID=29494 RepID=UPI002573B210|nr:methyl-accepting chemotaxis protein [Vibrio furnissii]WJG24096.1 methyl-accepting chemotaxis protein [Vibrio furnissii]